MSQTFGVMLDRMADEMSRSDLDSQARNCIKSAIQHYERKRFYFNEDYTTAVFNTVAAQEYYTSADDINIPNFSGIDTVVMTVNNARQIITPKRKDWFDSISSLITTNGIPEHYNYYARAIRFYPIPQAIYSTRVSGAVRITTLSATTDTNVWTSEAEALIRNAAKRILYLDYLKDKENADNAAIEEKSSYDALIHETAMRLSTNIHPTQF